MNEQQLFWKEKYSQEYIKRNSNYDFELGIKGCNEIFRKIKDDNQFIEYYST
jgi:hypothetical protein